MEFNFVHVLSASGFVLCVIEIAGGEIPMSIPIAVYFLVELEARFDQIFPTPDGQHRRDFFPHTKPV